MFLRKTTRRHPYVFLMCVISSFLFMTYVWIEFNKEDITSYNATTEHVQIFDVFPIILNKYNITTTKNFRQHRENRELPQKCKVPVLDPYHPEIMSSIKKSKVKRKIIPECRYPDLSEVTDDGLLQVIL